MILAKALIAGPNVRREFWPDGVHVRSSSGHSIGSTPITIVDVDDEGSQPPGVRRHLTLCRSDPRDRVYPFQDLGGGLVIQKHDVVHFEVPDWQPSIEDLFAHDWVVL